MLAPDPVARNPNAMAVAPGAMSGNPDAVVMIIWSGGDDDRRRFRSGRRDAAEDHETANE